MRSRFLISALLAVSAVYAHPLGNFSINHYAKFVAAGDLEMVYAIDLAEIPTFELLRDWKLESTSPHGELQRKAGEQIQLWLANLAITTNGVRVVPRVERTELVIADGAGNLPIARITAHIRLGGRPGKTEYEDRNYPGRAGWKEIVIIAEPGAHLTSASQGDADRSQALSSYPPDPTVAPPQDLRASFDWTAELPNTVAKTQTPAPPAIHSIAQPESKPALPPAALTAKNAPAGTVVRNDFLSRLLHRQDITLGMALIALAAAFGLGAAHALTPGHGKTIVAAYLVGSRGTLKHAAFLGAMVTFTHTVSVFALGLATLFLFRFIVPEKITQILGAVSGLSIIAIGGSMLYKRLRGTRVHHGHHHHHDGHHHDHADGHDHEHHHHDHEHPHTHEHGHDHDHHHGPGGHSHVPDGDITWGSLVALAISGGLVPCESALVLLLSAIALGRVALGLLLLISFSCGLAIVLMGIGVLVIYAKNLLPDRSHSSHNPFFLWIPVVSAAVVVVVGILMTGVSLGWLRPGWLAS